MSTIIVSEATLSTINGANPAAGKPVAYGQYNPYYGPSYMDFTGISSRTNIGSYTDELAFTNPFASDTGFALTFGYGDYHTYFSAGGTNATKMQFSKLGSGHNTTGAHLPTFFSFMALGEMA